MNFSESVSTCISKWITFSGRASRSEYWWFTLFWAVLAIACGIGIFLAVSSNLPLLAVPPVVLIAFLYVASISVTVRRLHDRGLSGWWVGGLMVLNAGGAMAEGSGGIFRPVMSVAVLIASAALLVQMVKRGTEGPNPYGPDPFDAAPGATALAH